MYDSIDLLARVAAEEAQNERKLDILKSQFATQFPV